MSWLYRAADDPLLPFTQPTQYARLLQQLIETWPEYLPPPMMPPLPDYPMLNNLFLSDPSVQQHQAYGDMRDDAEDYDPGQDYDEGEIFEEDDARKAAAAQQLPTTSKQSTSSSTPNPTTAGLVAEKEDQAKKLQDLRAQLLAKKKVSDPLKGPNMAPPTEPAQMRKSTPAPAVAASRGQSSAPLPPPLNLSSVELERLVAQGRAAAAGQDLKDQSPKTTSGREVEQHKKLQELSARLASKEAEPRMAEKPSSEAQASNPSLKSPSTRQPPGNGNSQAETYLDAAYRRESYTADDRTSEADAASTNPPSVSGAPLVPDADYYAELPEWLEVTGYHNTEYRQAKLARYRKMQHLTAEIAKLKQEDPASFEIWEARNAMPPPPLPQRYTSSNVGNQMPTPNDTPPGTAISSSFDAKRQRSPLSSRTIDAPPSKVPRSEPVDFREERERYDRDRRPSSRDLEHRITGASEDISRSRGPAATERRQNHDHSYRHYDDRYSREGHAYDQYIPQRAQPGGRQQQQQQQQQQPHKGQGQKQTGLRGKRGK